MTDDRRRARRAGVTARLVGRLRHFGLGPERTGQLLAAADLDSCDPDPRVARWAAATAVAVRLLAARDDVASINAITAAFDEVNET